MTQTTFQFAEPRKPKPQTAPYVKGSETSKAAAEAIGQKLNELQREVYLFIKTQGDFGATDDEIIQYFMLKNWHSNTPRPRRVELFKKGLVRAKNLKRKTSSGRMAAVWVAK